MRFLSEILLKLSRLFLTNRDCDRSLIIMLVTQHSYLETKKIRFRIKLSKKNIFTVKIFHLFLEITRVREKNENEIVFATLTES